MSRDLADRWEWLRPWCESVCGKLRIDPQDHFEQRVLESKHVTVILSLSCAEEPDNEEMNAIRDALLLLSLVARADTRGWAYAMKTLCKVEAPFEQLLNWLSGGTIDGLRFGLEFENGTNQGNILEKLLLQPASSTTRDQHLKNAVRQVSTQVAPGSRLTRFGRVDIPIAIFFSISESSDVDLWAQLVRIRDQIGAWRFPILLPACEDSDLNCGFVLELLPSFEVQCDVSLKTLESMEQSMEQITEASCNLTIPLVHFDVEGHIEESVISDDDDYSDDSSNNNDEDSEDLAAQAQLLGRLFERALCASNYPDATVPTLEEIRICATLQTPAEFARLCSAVGNCRRTTKLTLQMDQLEVDAGDRPIYSDSDCDYIPKDRRRRDASYSSCSDLSEFEDEEEGVSPSRQRAWQSMAYALFSSFARSYSTITSVELVLDAMLESDIVDFAELLESDDPTRMIFGYSSLSDGEIRGTNVVTLKNGTALKLQPLDGDEGFGDTEEWELDADVCGVQVIEYQQDKAVVIVPGYGSCVVASSTVPTVKHASPEPKQITRLSLCLECVDKEDCAGIPGFLQLIGTPLTYLSINACVGRFTFLPAIISSCPNLKTLILRKCVNSANDFLQAYSLNQVHLEDLECRFDDLIPLTAELSDTTTSLSQTLKGITCCLGYSRSPDSVASSIATMLESNTILEYLHLVVARSNTDEFSHMLVERFQYQRLDGVRVPLPVKSRLAFLSVFTSPFLSGLERELKRTCQSLGGERSINMSGVAFSRDILERIFDFAASCRRRRVYITSNHKWED